MRRFFHLWLASWTFHYLGVLPNLSKILEETAPILGLCQIFPKSFLKETALLL
jgi:hypothetical protein